MNGLHRDYCRPFGTDVTVGIPIPWADAHGYILSSLSGLFQKKDRASTQGEIIDC